MDCWVAYRGVSAASGTPQRLLTLDWRTDYFSFRGVGYTSGGACTSAYIEVYAGDADGRYLTPALMGPVCGNTPPASVTTSSPSIVVHMYIEAPANYDGTTVTVNATNFNGPYINFTGDLTSYFVGKQLSA